MLCTRFCQVPIIPGSFEVQEVLAVVYNTKVEECCVNRCQGSMLYHYLCYCSYDVTCMMGRLAWTCGPKPLQMIMILTSCFPKIDKIRTMFDFCLCHIDITMQHACLRVLDMALKDT